MMLLSMGVALTAIATLCDNRNPCIAFGLYAVALLCFAVKIVYLRSTKRVSHPVCPKRVEVSDEDLSWTVDVPGYYPPDFTHHTVFENSRDLITGNKWADPPELTSELREELGNRITYSMDGWEQLLKDTVAWDWEGRPLNPTCRTGLRGRNLLGKWGPNHAADPIVTRYDPDHEEQLQVVVIKRNDTGDWALPGGMVDAGEKVSVTVKREFTEEAGNITDQHRRKKFKQLTDKLFANGRMIFRGRIPDPRNTDNAWTETAAFHFHCSLEVGKLLPLEAGDDADKVKWINVDPRSDEYLGLYGGHLSLVEKVRLEMQA